MGEFDKLADEIYRDRVRRARLTPPGEKLRDSWELFDGVVERMKAGVRSRHPDADEPELLERVRGQLARLRRLHERDIYRPHPAGK